MDIITKSLIISNRSYHQEYQEWIGSTSLKQMLVSPKWFKYCQEHPEESKMGLETELKGSVFHSMLASIANTGNMDGFSSEWEVFDPPINEKTGNPFGYDTKIFKEAYETAQILSGGKELCSQTEVNLAKAMIESMINDPYLGADIRFLLKNGRAENSYFVEYEDMKFKYRPDLETRRRMMDWKTTIDSSLEAIPKIIEKFDYDLSAAFYQFLDHLRTGIWREYYWVFAEKTPPYDFLIVDGSPWCFSIKKEGGDYIINPEDEAKPGVRKLFRLLNQLQWCYENDKWPGYSVFVQPDWKGHRIYAPPVPGYIQKKVSEKIFYV